MENIGGPVNPALAVGLLDHNDLQCCGQQMLVRPNRAGYICAECGWVITQIAFVQNSHGTQEARRARIANKEIGYQGVLVDDAAA
jgi:hypothetical protein